MARNKVLNGHKYSVNRWTCRHAGYCQLMHLMHYIYLGIFHSLEEVPGNLNFRCTIPPSTFSALEHFHKSNY